MPLRDIGSVPATEAEQALGPHQIADGEEVDHQRQDPHAGDLLVQLIDLQRDEHGGPHRCDILAPATHEPQTRRLDKLERAIPEDRRGDEGQGAVVRREGGLDEMDRAGVGQVDAEPLEDRSEQRQVAVEDLLQGRSRSVEAPDPEGEQDDERSADPLLDGEQPQHQRVLERPAPQDQRRLVRRTPSLRRSSDKRPAAQAAPRLPQRGLGAQPGRERGFVRGIGRMAMQPARAQVEVEMTPGRQTGRHTVGPYVTGPGTGRPVS